MSLARDRVHEYGMTHADTMAEVADSLRRSAANLRAAGLGSPHILSLQTRILRGSDNAGTPRDWPDGRLKKMQSVTGSPLGGGVL